MRRVYIASVGFTKITDQWKKSLTDLAVEAGVKALKASHKIRPEQVIVANMFSAHSSSQEHLGALVADGLGLSGCSAFKVEAGAASGGAAAHAGFSSVKSGEVKSALVIGVEKMRDLEPTEAARALSMEESAEYTQFFGVTVTSMNAMLTRLYIHEFDVTRDELSIFPVLAHKNALTAEHAQFRKTIVSEDVARSMIVSDPLRLLDCAPVGDGAAAILLVGEEKVSEIDGEPAEVVSSTVATDRFNFYGRDDLLDFPATRKAVQMALSKAGLALKDLDLIELHDAFSAMPPLIIEAMGLSGRGDGLKDAKTGKFERDGELPINTFGGLKGRGHPIGATGIYQLAEAYLQLAGRAGANQVMNPRHALTHNIGGIDATAVVHILRRV